MIRRDPAAIVYTKELRVSTASLARVTDNNMASMEKLVMNSFRFVCEK